VTEAKTDSELYDLANGTIAALCDRLKGCTRVPSRAWSGKALENELHTRNDD
jgi:hypothetical protein